MTKKQKTMILLTFLFIGVCLCVFFYVPRKLNESKEEYGEINEIGAATDYYNPEEVSDYADTGGDLIEDGTRIFKNGVLCDNINILADTTLPLYGIHSLEPYMLRYLNYYIGEGEYHIKIMDFKEDTNFPSFHVSLLNTGDTIKCTYNIATQRYSFSCKNIEKNYSTDTSSEENSADRIQLDID